MPRAVELDARWARALHRDAVAEQIERRLIAGQLHLRYAVEELLALHDHSLQEPPEPPWAGPTPEFARGAPFGASYR